MTIKDIANVFENANFCFYSNYFFKPYDMVHFRNM